MSETRDGIEIGKQLQPMLYPGPLREVMNEVLAMLRVDATVDDIDVLADSIEKSEWLRDQTEKAFLSGCEDAFAFDRCLLGQMRRAPAASDPSPAALDRTGES